MSAIFEMMLKPSYASLRVSPGKLQELSSLLDAKGIVYKKSAFSFVKKQSFFLNFITFQLELLVSIYFVLQKQGNIRLRGHLFQHLVGTDIQRFFCCYVSKTIEIHYGRKLFPK